MSFLKVAIGRKKGESTTNWYVLSQLQGKVEKLVLLCSVLRWEGELSGVTGSHNICREFRGTFYRLGLERTEPMPCPNVQHENIGSDPRVWSPNKMPGDSLTFEIRCRKEWPWRHAASQLQNQTNHKLKRLSVLIVFLPEVRTSCFKEVSLFHWDEKWEARRCNEADYIAELLIHCIMAPGMTFLASDSRKKRDILRSTSL